MAYDGRDQEDLSHAAAGDDALFESGASGAQGVFNAVFLLFDLGLGGSTDFDHGHAAGQFGQTFLQLLAVEIGIGDLDLGLELVDAGFDLVELAGAVHDGGVVFVDDHFAGVTELGDGGVLEFEAHLVGDDFAAGEDGDVFEHALAAIAEAGGFDGDAGEGAAQLVHHEGRQGFAFDVFSDDQQRAAGLNDFLEHREKILDRADLAVGDQDVRIFEHGFHALGVGDEVRGDVALVELHAFA